MKGHLFIQRKKGKLRKGVESFLVDINGGENKHDRKLYAMDRCRLVAELYMADMVIGADGIIFKGYEIGEGGYYMQEWWVKT